MIGHTVRYRKIRDFPRGRFIRVIYIVDLIPPNSTQFDRHPKVLGPFSSPGETGNVWNEYR